MSRSLSLDFETRATVDLKLVGAYVYAKHPATSVLCASYSFDGETVRQWRPWLGETMPADLAKAFRDPKVLIRAWNASFERLILQHVLKVNIPAHRFRCTMARARSMALPGALDNAAKALQLPVQKANNRVMLKWCKPLPKGGWADDPAEYRELCAYCDVDVLTEMSVGRVVRELTPDEQRDYEITEAINDNGLPVDVELAHAAQRYAAEEIADIRKQLRTLTGGAVRTPREFAKIKAWLEANLPDALQLQPNAKGKISFDARTRAALLEEPSLPDDVREFIQLVDDGGRASTAKFAVMEARAVDDGRVHGAFVFNGAGQTGRFCVHFDTRVDTLDGPRRIVDLRCGDMVLTHRGRYRPVLNLFYKGREILYRFTFANGAYVTATAAHRILTTQGWYSLGASTEQRSQQPDSRAGGEAALQDRRVSCEAVWALANRCEWRRSEAAEGCTGETCACPRQGDLCEVFTAAIYDTTQNRQDVWCERRFGGECVASAYRAGCSEETAARKLLSLEVRPQECHVRPETQTETGLAARLRCCVDWPRIHAITPAGHGEGARVEETARAATRTPYRRGQNEQYAEQSGFSYGAGASAAACSALEKVEVVGVGGVWDIEVAEDHSYVAQGLIHHNSSHGVQLQNLVRAHLDNAEDVIEAIVAGWPSDQVVKLSGHNMLTTLARIIRPSIVAEDGNEFVYGDWSSIEARLLPWLSGDRRAQPLLDRFERKEDIYVAQASGMFGVPEAAINEDQRQSGKISVLSFGYGGGFRAYQAMARNYGIKVDDDTADGYKHRWRMANPWAPDFWRALEDAAFAAVHNPGHAVSAGRVTYEFQGNVLYAQLPSGRLLCYPFARIETVISKFGPQSAVTCIKGAWHPAAGEPNWPRMQLYGGILAENATQGEAASLLRQALRTLQARGYLPNIVAHVHDEIILEVPKRRTNAAVSDLHDVMTTAPAWASGLPLDAKIVFGKVYTK